ncbi:MAG: hypothetical protein KY463_16520, partial [Actinobacteria bacterium]|nr:hypothetical protein [Actinomycetota bacterium]
MLQEGDGAPVVVLAERLGHGRVLLAGEDLGQLFAEHLDARVVERLGGGQVAVRDEVQLLLEHVLVVTGPQRRRRAVPG